MNKSKRRSIKVAALSGTFLSSPLWVKPIINTIALPAHAQTSPLTGTLILLESFFSGDIRDSLEPTTCYQVDDSPASNSSEPQLIEVAEQNNDRTVCVTLESFSVGGIIDESDQIMRITIGSTTSVHAVGVSDDTSQDPNGSRRVTFTGVPAAVTIDFLSVSDSPWQLFFSVSQTGDEGFTVSDITLSSVI